MPSTAGAYPSTSRCHQFLQLGSQVTEQLDQVVFGSNKVPLTVNLLQTSQQKHPQAPAFLDLAVHRLDDRLALGVDPGSLLAPELAGHAGFGISTPGDRAAFRGWWLTMRQAVGGDVGINSPIGAGVGVVLTPVGRDHRHYIWQRTGAGGDPLQHGFQVLGIGRLVAHAHRHDHLVISIDGQLAVVTLQIGTAGLHQMAVGAYLGVCRP